MTIEYEKYKTIKIIRTNVLKEIKLHINYKHLRSLIIKIGKLRYNPSISVYIFSNIRTQNAFTYYNGDRI